MNKHAAKVRHIIVNWLVMISLPVISLQAAEKSKPVIIQYDALHHPVIGRQGMVASQNGLATRVGADILKL